MTAKTIAVIDAETDPFDYGFTNIRPFCWGFFDGENYKKFWNIKDKKKEIHCSTALLIDYLETLETPHIIYAHNGGKFDFHFLGEYFNHFEPLTIINGRIAKVKIGIHELRDSYSLIPLPLAAFQKEEFDYNLMLPEIRFDREAGKLIDDYLESDCRNLYELVKRFIDNYGMHLTMAGASIKMFEKMEKEKDKSFSLPSTKKHYYDTLKPFYYGGRTQCFETGIIKKLFKMVDINSAYPFAMLENHPFGTRYIRHGPIAGNRLMSLIKREYVGNLFFDVIAVSKGALPFRDRTGSLHYPDDDKPRRYTVTGWEIKAGIETDTLTVLKAYDVWEFALEECRNFSDYILRFYNERMKAKEAGDTALTLFTKLFMNSLYGKFGANPENYSKYLITPQAIKQSLIFGPNTPEEINTFVENDLEGWRYGGDIGDNILAETDLDESERRYYNVATAASITGYVRAYLWRAISKSKNPIYCDTDSIAAESFDGLKYGGNLGEWDYVYAAGEETNEYDFAAIAGRKMYALKDINGNYKTASKGVRLSAEEIIRVAQGETVEHTAIAPVFSVRKAPATLSRKVRLTVKELVD